MLTFSFYYFCVLCSCAHACICRRMCLCGDQRSGWNVFLYHFFTLVFTFKNLCLYDVLVDVEVHLCVHLCGCLHVKDTCGNQRTGLGVCSSFHPFETRSLFLWIVTGQLAHELPGYLAVRALTGLQMRVTVTSFYMSSRESNSGPYHCMTSHFTRGADTSAMSLLYIWRQTLSMKAPGIVVSLPSQSWEYRCMLLPTLHMGPGDPHACTIDALLTEPSPNPILC